MSAKRKSQKAGALVMDLALPFHRTSHSLHFAISTPSRALTERMMGAHWPNDQQKERQIRKWPRESFLSTHSYLLPQETRAWGMFGYPAGQMSMLSQPIKGRGRFPQQTGKRVGTGQAIPLCGKQRPERNNWSLCPGRSPDAIFVVRSQPCQCQPPLE